MLKTSATAEQGLVDAIREAHSYEVPEIVTTAIDAGDAVYLARIDAVTG